MWHVVHRKCSFQSVSASVFFFLCGWSVAKVVANELARKQKIDSAPWKIKPNNSSFWAEPDRVTAALRVLCHQTQQQQLLGRARQSYFGATRSLSNQECAAQVFIYVVTLLGRIHSGVDNSNFCRFGMTPNIFPVVMITESFIRYTIAGFELSLRRPVTP